MSTINTLKKVADSTVGVLNRGGRYLLEQMDPANKNLFQFIMYPKSIEDIGLASSDFSSAAADVASIAVDTLVSQVYLRSVDIGFLGFEYENQNELKAIKGLVHPETVTLNLLEDEFGTIGNYLYKWVNKIAFPVEETIGTSKISRINYVFANNQEGAKKNALIVPQGGNGLPSLRYIKLYGLKFMSMENITFSHEDGDPLIYAVTCSVDSVWFKPLF